MYHISPATGSPGLCKATIACPFGGAEEHFSSPAEAEAHYAKAMEAHTFVAHQRKSSKEELQAAELAFKEALAGSNDFAAEKEAWETAAINHASSAEGLVHFQQLLAKTEAGSPASAAYQHIIAEGNRLRMASMNRGSLAAIFHQPAPEVSTHALAPAILPSPVRWADYPVKVEGYGSVTVGTSYIFDLQKYEKSVDAFLADPAGADERILADLHPPYRAFTDLQVSHPGDELKEDPAKWREKMEKLEDHIRSVATVALAHPKASPKDFKVAIEEFGADYVLNLEGCPQEAKEDYIRETKGKVSDKLLPFYRNESYRSNRVALYLAAADPDTMQRQEAFHKVIVAGMETFTEKDRLWMARNLDKFPTSEGTVATLKSSLRSWAQGYADASEREKLLALTEDEPASVPEVRRRFLRRS